MDNQRLKEVVNYLKFNRRIFNDADLAKQLNKTRSYISEILSNKRSVTKKFCETFCSIYTEIDLHWLLTGEGEMLKKEDTAPHGMKPSDDGQGIPLLPISAMAGALSGDIQVLEYDCERYVVPMFKGADFLIPVKGSSMYPKYASGDIVACKRIAMDRLFFQWNKVYVIDTDQGALIKRIKPGSDDEHICIVSDNVKYEPFELPISSIYAVALVIGVIRLE